MSLNSFQEEDDIYAKDVVSIHTKVAKEAKARAEEQEVRKVVMVKGRRASVRRRKRLRKVDGDWQVARGGWYLAISK